MADGRKFPPKCCPRILAQRNTAAGGSNGPAQLTLLNADECKWYLIIH
jgi:hypothetical protein